MSKKLCYIAVSLFFASVLVTGVTGEAGILLVGWGVSALLSVLAALLLSQK